MKYQRSAAVCDRCQAISHGKRLRSEHKNSKPIRQSYYPSETAEIYSSFLFDFRHPSELDFPLLFPALITFVAVVSLTVDAFSAHIYRVSHDSMPPQQRPNYRAVS
jgi:hypothetical protein